MQRRQRVRHPVGRRASEQVRQQQCSRRGHDILPGQRGLLALLLLIDAVHVQSSAADSALLSRLYARKRDGGCWKGICCVHCRVGFVNAEAQGTCTAYKTAANYCIESRVACASIWWQHGRGSQLPRTFGTTSKQNGVIVR